MVMKRLASALLAASLWGCLKDRGPNLGSPIARHPDDRFIAEEIPPAARISLTNNGLSAIGSKALTVIQESRKRAEIGALRSPPQEVFGEIVASAVDRNGTAFLLDGGSSQVRVFGRDGQFIGAVAGRGRGPGQLTQGLSLALDDHGHLYVGDLSHVVNVFTFQNGRLRFLRALSIGVAPHSMCVIGSRLYVHGLVKGDNHIIREYDLVGHLHRTFGTLYTSPQFLITSAL